MYASEIVLVNLAWTLGSPWRPVRECEITRVITTRCITLILECTYKSICDIILCHIDTRENFQWMAKCIIFDIRKTVLVPGVCPCIHICDMMHHMHTGKAMGTRKKLTSDSLWLVTMRPIAHSGRCVCIRNCVGEFGMDTGQPLVTSNGI